MPSIEPSRRRSSVSAKALLKINKNSNSNLLQNFKNFCVNIVHKLSAINPVRPPAKPDIDERRVEQQEIFHNLLSFNAKTVEDAMVPRTDIVAVKHDVELSKLTEIVSKTHHTRTLIYEGSLDNIIGFVHIKDLFTVIAEKQNFKLKNIMHKPLISTPSMKLNDLLMAMQRQRTHIAIVVDEFGGVDGIVSINDIIEQIVGRIDDEHDKQENALHYRIINKNTVITNSRVEVEELETVLGVTLKDENDDFVTIGGLVLDKIGYMPAIGTIINIADNVSVEVIDANSRTLKSLKLVMRDSDKI